MVRPMTEQLAKPKQILLVDDNQQFLAFSQEFLGEYQDIEVAGIAISAEEALALLERVRPHLMIVDLAMPGTSGIELTHQIKAQHPHLPVIILTLLDSPHHRQAALDAGADAFVPKASMDTDLVPTIRRLSRANECRTS
jgi:DNA-binding NarL/FixJ family response regulator